MRKKFECLHCTLWVHFWCKIGLALQYCCCHCNDNIFNFYCDSFSQKKVCSIAKEMLALSHFTFHFNFHFHFGRFWQEGKFWVPGFSSESFFLSTSKKMKVEMWNIITTQCDEWFAQCVQSIDPLFCNPISIINHQKCNTQSIVKSVKKLQKMTGYL